MPTLREWLWGTLAVGFSAMMSTLAPFSWSHLNQFYVGTGVLVVLALVSVMYAVGLRHVRTWPRGRSVSFYLGVVVVILATQSVIGVYDTYYFSDHMIQHLLLIMIAAPLIALGAPLELARASSEKIARVLSSPPATVLLHPLVAFVLYAAFIVGTHLTSFFNVMIEHAWIDQAEQLGFVLVGYLFFRHAFGIEPDLNINPGLRLVYVMAAVPVDTITGLALDMQKTNPYHDFTLGGSSSHSAIINNVHLGGAIMWIGGDALMLLTLIPIAFTWVAYEAQKTRELDAQLDAAGL